MSSKNASMTENDWNNLREQLRSLVSVYSEMNNKMVDANMFNQTVESKKKVLNEFQILRQNFQELKISSEKNTVQILKNLNTFRRRINEFYQIAGIKTCHKAKTVTKSSKKPKRKSYTRR